MSRRSKQAEIYFHEPLGEKEQWQNTTTTTTTTTNNNNNNKHLYSAYIAALSALHNTHTIVKNKKKEIKFWWKLILESDIWKSRS